jgi:predicted ATP-grasp superfamily ATP-dependent carboligase
MVLWPTEQNTENVSQTDKLMRFLGYRGIASLEFKYQPKDGHYYFIEVNPRLPWYSALFAEAGINLPYLAYLDLTGRPHAEAFKAVQRNGVYWISLEKDLYSSLMRKGNRLANLMQWFRFATSAGARDWFDWRDPLRFLRNTLDFLPRAIRKVRSIIRNSVEAS